VIENVTMLIVVRHGRTAANASGLLLGRLDPPLDELGMAQAGAVAAAVGRVDRVVASPLLRSRATAERFGVPVELDDRWIELDYGEWDGRPTADVPIDVWAAWRADLDFAPPGGETLRAVGARVRAACADLAADAEAGTVVVVTHVSPLKAAFAWALGAGDEVSWRCFVSPASITRIGIGPTGPSLVAFNEVGHLAGLDPKP
jgi:broad specificity phosphatase PhoE